jgi:hypothetical protein
MVDGQRTGGTQSMAKVFGMTFSLDFDRSLKPSHLRSNGAEKPVHNPHIRLAKGAKCLTGSTRDGLHRTDSSMPLIGAIN